MPVYHVTAVGLDDKMTQVFQHTYTVEADFKGSAMSQARLLARAACASLYWVSITKVTTEGEEEAPPVPAPPPKSRKRIANG